MKTKIPTKAQLRIAKEFKIPISQASTINVAKAKGYKQYLKSQIARDEMFLDNIIINKEV